MASVMARGDHVIEFLDMLAAERGASPNTIEAYGSDLDGFLQYLSEAGGGPLTTTTRHIQGYIAMIANAGQAPTSRSRRLSAIKQFYRFLFAEGVIEADPTSGLQGPKKQRSLPKVLSIAEVDRLLALAGTDKTRILSAQIWLADMVDFPKMNAVWDAWVPQGHTPARATGESKLATPDYLVEVIVVAAL